ncbi:hypothetical protein BC938DRAFT_477323 [Jimgerdemannia flammicorona]|uniref:Uncharacterized protein n=1 Tax=Jimgerdemannia flammicorona TaxID=994334 RepID=A0A433QPJ1_9FUNG|nr:hypothetical protein BC938DRAFT_477323 [Jimgerdemannia flammicorona]
MWCGVSFHAGHRDATPFPHPAPTSIPRNGTMCASTTAFIYVFKDDRPLLAEPTDVTTATFASLRSEISAALANEDAFVVPRPAGLFAVPRAREGVTRVTGDRVWVQSANRIGQGARPGEKGFEPSDPWVFVHVDGDPAWAFERTGEMRSYADVRRVLEEEVRMEEGFKFVIKKWGKFEIRRAREADILIESEVNVMSAKGAETAADCEIVKVEKKTEVKIEPEKSSGSARVNNEMDNAMDVGESMQNERKRRISAVIEPSRAFRPRPFRGLAPKGSHVSRSVRRCSTFGVPYSTFLWDEDPRDDDYQADITVTKRARSQNEAYRETREMTTCHACRRVCYALFLYDWCTRYTGYNLTRTDRSHFHTDTGRKPRRPSRCTNTLSGGSRCTVMIDEACLQRRPGYKVFEFSRVLSNFKFRRVPGRGPGGRDVDLSKVRAIAMFVHALVCFAGGFRIGSKIYLDPRRCVGDCNCTICLRNRGVRLADLSHRLCETYGAQSLRELVLAHPECLLPLDADPLG